MKRRYFIQSSLLAGAVSVPGIRGVYALARTGPVSDVAAVTGDNREITLRGSEIADLAAKLRGQLLLAGDKGYDDARRILNPSFDKRPALIAQVTNAADVQTAINFARTHSLLVAVKCGGHSHSGQSTCDRGMLIDLSSFRGVRVDPQARRALVSGGTLLGQVDHESLAHGLVTPLGTVSHTGVGGLTLGGGFGRTARRFGMAIDNLESVDIVTADGQLRHASAKENPGSLLGCARRQRQFRSRDGIRVSPASDATPGRRRDGELSDRKSAGRTDHVERVRARLRRTSCTWTRHAIAARRCAGIDRRSTFVTADRRRALSVRSRRFASSASRIRDTIKAADFEAVQHA